MNYPLLITVTPTYNWWTGGARECKPRKCYMFVRFPRSMPNAKLTLVWIEGARSCGGSNLICGIFIEWHRLWVKSGSPQKNIKIPPAVIPKSIMKLSCENAFNASAQHKQSFTSRLNHIKSHVWVLYTYTPVNPPPLPLSGSFNLRRELQHSALRTKLNPMWATAHDWNTIDLHSLQHLIAWQ